MSSTDSPLILHQFLISPLCDKVRRILHFKQLDYEVREYPLAARSEIRAMYAAGKLPCLEHGGQFIGDSTDIAHYLEEQFPQPALFPTDLRQRGLVHVFEDWADESLYFYEMYWRFTQPHNAARNLPRMLHSDKRWFRALMLRLIPAGIRKIIEQQGLGRKSREHVLRDLNRHITALDERLQLGEWLVGESLTLADISVYAELGCVRDSREGGELIAESKLVSAWMSRVEEATGGVVPGSWEPGGGEALAAVAQ